MRRPALRRWLAPIAVLAIWGLWWQWSVLGLDDYHNTTRQGQAYGRTTWSVWWENYVADYTRVNGRLADPVVRILIVRGQLWRLTMPLVMVGLWWAMVSWLPRRSRTDLARWAVAAIPLALLCLQPSLGGNAFLTLSSAVNYVLSLACFLAGAVPVVRALRDEPTPTWMIAGCAVLALLGGMMHENTAMASMASVACLLMLRRRALRRPAVAAVAVGWLVGGMIMLSAPGLRARSDAQAKLEEQLPIGVKLLVRVSNGLQNMAVLDSALLVTLGLVVAWLALRAEGERARSWRRQGAWCLAALTVLWAGVSHRVTRIEVVVKKRLVEPEVMALVTAASWALLCVAFLGTLLVLLWRSSAFVDVERWLFVAMLATCVAPVLVGGGPVRAWSSGMMLGAVLILSLVMRAASDDAMASTGLTSLRRTVAITVLCLAAYGLARGTWGMAANHARWQQVDRQIARAVATGHGPIEVPLSYPDNDFAYRLSYGTDFLAEDLRQFYRVPAGVKLTWVEK